MIAHLDTAADLGALEKEIRAPAFWGCFILAGLILLGPTALVAVMVSDGHASPLAALPSIAIGVGLIWLTLALRPWLRIYERGVARKGLLGTAAVAYADVATVSSFDASLTPGGQAHVGGLAGALARESQKGEIYTVSGADGRSKVKIDRLFGRGHPADVKAVVDAAVKSAAERAEAELKGGGEFKAANGLSLTATELRGTKQGFLSNSEVALPLERVEKVEEGSVYDKDAKAGFLGKSASFSYPRATQDLVLVKLLTRRKVVYRP